MKRTTAGDMKVHFAPLDANGQPGEWREALGTFDIAGMRSREITLEMTAVNPDLLALLLGPPPEPKKIGALVYEKTFGDGVHLATKKVTYADGRTSYSASIARRGAEVGDGLYAYEVLCTAAWDGQMSVVLVEWPHRAIHASVVGKKITGPRGFADFIAELHFGTNLSEQTPGWARG